MEFGSGVGWRGGMASDGKRRSHGCEERSGRGIGNGQWGIGTLKAAFVRCIVDSHSMSVGLERARICIFFSFSEGSCNGTDGCSELNTPVVSIHLKPCNARTPHDIQKCRYIQYISQTRSLCISNPSPDAEEPWTVLVSPPSPPLPSGRLLRRPHST